MVYCIPYILVKEEGASVSSPITKKIWLFLDANGTEAIELPGATKKTALKFANAFLKDNELVSKSVYLKGDGIVFAEIDVAATPDLSAFYTWSEVIPDVSSPPKEVWRLFLWMEGEAGQDIWGVNTYLRSIPLRQEDAGLSVFDAIQEIVQQKSP